MRTIALSIFFFMTCVIHAQDSLTTGEIFDFEIGDEFQARAMFSLPGTSQSSVTRRIVTDKYYNAAGDTVFYEFFRDDYSFYASMSNPQGTYSFGTGTVNDLYTNLDSLYEPVDYLDTLETEWGPYPNPIDYIFYEDTALCDVPAVRFQIRNDNFEWEYHYYAKGLGTINFTSGNYQYQMFYYKKGNFECGERDTLSIEDNVKELSQKTIRAYPNPLIGDLVYLDISEYSNFNYSISSINGTLIQTGRVENNTIAVQNLSAGSYVLKLFNNHQSFTPIHLIKLTP
jgi:hypothetical protein